MTSKLLAAVVAILSITACHKQAPAQDVTIGSTLAIDSTPGPAEVGKRGVRPPSGEALVGSVRVPLPPGATVVTQMGARGDFGGTLIDLDERMSVEVASLPTSGLTLRAYVDSVVAAENIVRDPDWRLDPPTDTIIEGRPVLVLSPECGDCRATRAYVEVAGVRIVVIWGVDGLGSHSADQRDSMGWSLVASLH